MYKTFFGLKREPFAVAADPRFIYLSPQHRSAIRHLLFGLHSGAGFILLTGEIGAGKSVVCRAFLRLLPPDTDVANVVNPRISFDALLRWICNELRVEVPPGCPDLIDALHGHLLLAQAQKRTTLIMVDEAQALSHEVLELLRLLTNLDSTGRRLQIFLIGQPELRETLRLPALEPVSQRIVARYHLEALPEPQTALYIVHRLKVAGLEGPLPFDDTALRAIHRICHGIPRRINVLCDRAMLTARAMGTKNIDGPLVEQISSTVFDGADVDRTSDSAASATAAVPPTEPTAAESIPFTAKIPAQRSRPNWRDRAIAAGLALVLGIALASMLLDSTHEGGGSAAPTPIPPSPKISHPPAPRTKRSDPADDVAAHDATPDIPSNPVAPGVAESAPAPRDDLGRLLRP